MIFKQLNAGSCRTYLIASEKSREALLVDPVLTFVEEYLKVLEKENLCLSHIIDTHTHADHLSAGPALADHLAAAYVMHTSAQPNCLTYRVKGGERLKIGELSVTFEHTPGHTTDSMMLVLEGRLLTGDFLFIGDSGSGRLDLPTGDPGEHFDSLQKLKTFSDDLEVYPAHDYHERTKSTLGQERQTNPRLRFTSREDYVRFLSCVASPTPDWMLKVIQANYACTRNPKAVDIPVDLPCCEISGTQVAGTYDQVPAITPEEARDRIDSDCTLLVLDVRNPDEYLGPLGHIRNSLLIPLQELPLRIEEISDYRDCEIISVCKSGGRSSAAAKILIQAGFIRAASMKGGMIQWNENRYPVVTGSQDN